MKANIEVDKRTLKILEQIKKERRLRNYNEVIKHLVKGLMAQEKYALPEFTAEEVLGGYSIFHRTLADMSGPELESMVKKGAVAIVPIATIEWHGPHLPLGTDVYGVYLESQLVKKILAERGIESVIVPPYYWGIVRNQRETGWYPELGKFIGSFSTEKDTMTACLNDLFVDLDQWGFKKIYVINFHGSPWHNSAIFEAIKKARSKNIGVYYCTWQLTVNVYESTFKKPIPLPKEAIVVVTDSTTTTWVKTHVAKSKIKIADFHACQLETSLIWYWYPKVLRKSIRYIKKLKPVDITPEQIGKVVSGRWPLISPLGYIGDPAAATREYGKAICIAQSTDIANAIANHLQDSE